MDSSTYDYLEPTAEQQAAMKRLRAAAKYYAEVLENELPAGADKNHALRNHRTTAMWANVAMTRFSDGEPRQREK